MTKSRENIRGFDGMVDTDCSVLQRTEPCSNSLKVDTSLIFVSVGQIGNGFIFYNQNTFIMETTDRVAISSRNRY